MDRLKEGNTVRRAGGWFEGGTNRQAQVDSSGCYVGINSCSKARE
jgi:hypothetical protein